MSVESVDSNSELNFVTYEIPVELAEERQSPIIDQKKPCHQEGLTKLKAEEDLYQATQIIQKEEILKPEIEEISNWSFVKDAILNAPPYTYVVFDVDEVLINQDVLVQTGQYFLLDAEIISVLKLIEDKNMRAFALTHAAWGSVGTTILEDERIEGLRKLGIDFAQLSKCPGKYKINEYCEKNTSWVPWFLLEPQTALMKDGIIFARDQYYDLLSKGDVFFRTMKSIGEKPRKVIFIDDLRYNLESMKKHCKDRGVSFKGFKYSAPLCK